MAPWSSADDEGADEPVQTGGAVPGEVAAGSLGAQALNSAPAAAKTTAADLAERTTGWIGGTMA
jgi:hypothetical protein